MNIRHNDTTLIAGAGKMAQEYAKVLYKLKQKFIVVGRSLNSIQTFRKSTGFIALNGGVEKWLNDTKLIPNRAIVATNEETLSRVVISLLKKGVKSILVEKPGAFLMQDVYKIYKLAIKNNAKVYIGYNRRFYSSVIKAKSIINKDGGVLSFFFEFTEWSHIISRLNIPFDVKTKWFFHNSTHVVDLAFFLGGLPKKISSYTKSNLKWHPQASVFVGAGIAQNEIPFAYMANWEAPGRWGVEILTKKHRLIFRPLEKLYTQKIGGLEIKEVKINNKYDLIFKPGIYSEVKSFLTTKKYLCTIEEQFRNIEFYKKILGDLTENK